MSFFKKRKAVPKIVPENIDALPLLEQHEKGQVSDDEFIRAFSKATIFYSTPFGDYKDGGQRLFVLPAKDNTAYHPVFSSIERITEFYEKAGRLGFLIAEGTFASFLETVSKINKGKASVKMGTVIDPGYYGVTVEGDMLDTVIGMIKQ